MCQEKFQNSRSRLEPEIRSREFSLSSRSLRMLIINLDLDLDARDWRTFFLCLVSKYEIKCQKFSVSSQCARLSRRNSHSRLEIEKMTLADLCIVFRYFWIVRLLDCSFISQSGSKITISHHPIKRMQLCSFQAMKRLKSQIVGDAFIIISTKQYL